MPRFQVYRGIGGGPLLLDCQANVFSHLSTRLVVPLLRAGEVPRPTRRLHPVFVIDGVEYVMATHLATAIPVKALGEFAVSLDEHDGRILDAIDMLLCGY